MNKAVPWNINGVGFDAREAARQAARRQGKSLGEWLDGIIADHAAEHGLELDDIDSQDRIDAVKSKLERLSERPRASTREARNSSEYNRQETFRHAYDDKEYAAPTFDNRDNMSQEKARSRRERYGFEPDFEDGRRDFREERRSRPAPGPAEYLLDDAIEAMERRAARAERKSERALASIERLIESDGDRQDGDQEMFAALARKMAEMEARITHRVAGDQKPIKGALTRLEARLEAMSRRARAGTPGDAAGIPDAADMPSHSGHEPVTAAARPAAPARARLNDAIADITRQQRMLDENAASAPLPISRPAAPAFHGLYSAQAEHARPRDDAPAVLTQLQAGLAAIEARLATLDRNIPFAQSAAPANPATPMPDLRSLLQKSREPQVLDKIEQRLESLGTKIDHVQRRLETGAETPARPASTTQPLETLIRTLSDRIEAARAPGAHDHAIEELQEQIGHLSQRFEESGSELSILPALERSMQSLFEQIEDTRKTVETTATRAAQEAAAAALASGTRESPAALREIAALKSLQEQADQRANDTLGALHETLEKIVDRLSYMEDEIAQARLPAPRAAAITPAEASSAPRQNPWREQREPTAPARPVIPRRTVRREDLAAAPVVPDLVLGEADMVRAPARPAAGDTASRSRRAEPAPAPRAPADPEGTSGRADFIAAARRAAQLAQSEPSVLGLKEIAQTASAPASRTQLVEKSRHYLQTHKKPILMVMAALFVMAGTLAMIGGFQGGASQGTQGPKAPPPARAGAPVPSPNNQPAPRADLTGSPAPATYASQLTASDLSPSALPKAPVPSTEELAGSDKMPTGSLTAIPSFAAQEAARSKAETVSLRLKQMAEAGDAAAAYELASRYADGRELTRDFTQAASLFEKAAQSGFVPAEYKLGSLYEKGAGVPRDAAKARMWYAKAAEGGNPRAMHNLAVMIADGEGRPDYANAVQWFRKAAEYGVHDSQYNLAILYARGLGVKQSLVQSYQWFAVAAAQNDADAAKKRDEVAAKLSPDDLAIGKALAAAFHPKAPSPAATETPAPPGGWDSILPASPVKNEKAKLSSL